MRVCCFLTVLFLFSNQNLNAESKKSSAIGAFSVSAVLSPAENSSLRIDVSADGNSFIYFGRIPQTAQLHMSFDSGLHSYRQGSFDQKKNIISGKFDDYPRGSWKVYLIKNGTAYNVSRFESDLAYYYQDSLLFSNSFVFDFKKGVLVSAYSRNSTAPNNLGSFREELVFAEYDYTVQGDALCTDTENLYKLTAERPIGGTRTNTFLVDNEAYNFGPACTRTGWMKTYIGMGSENKMISHIFFWLTDKAAGVQVNGEKTEDGIQLGGRFDKAVSVKSHRTIEYLSRFVDQMIYF
jgi:hypothetical protein